MVHVRASCVIYRSVVGHVGHTLSLVGQNESCSLHGSINHIFDIVGLQTCRTSDLSDDHFAIVGLLTCRTSDLSDN